MQNSFILEYKTSIYVIRSLESGFFHAQGGGFAVDIAILSEGAFGGRDAELQCVELDDEPFATPEFTDNWMSGGGTEPLALTIRCRTLLLVYKDSGDARFGKALVIVDGKAAREINPLEVGWTHCNAALLFHGQAAEEHRVEIRPEEGKRFTVLGFGYVW